VVLPLLSVWLHAPYDRKLSAVPPEGNVVLVDPPEVVPELPEVPPELVPELPEVPPVVPELLPEVPPELLLPEGENKIRESKVRFDVVEPDVLPEVVEEVEPDVDAEPEVEPVALPVAEVAGTALELVIRKSANCVALVRSKLRSMFCPPVEVRSEREVPGLTLMMLLVLAVEDSSLAGLGDDPALPLVAAENTGKIPPLEKLVLNGDVEAAVPVAPAPVAPVLPAAVPVVPVLLDGLDPLVLLVDEGDDVEPLLVVEGLDELDDGLEDAVVPELPELLPEEGVVCASVVPATNITTASDTPAVREPRSPLMPGSPLRIMPAAADKLPFEHGRACLVPLVSSVQCSVARFGSSSFDQ
jgi:hypothetical protein